MKEFIDNENNNTLKVMRPMTKGELAGFIGAASGATDLFGDEGKDIENAIANFYAYFTDPKSYGNELTEAEYADVDKKMVNLYNLMVSKANLIDAPEDSSRKKAINALLNHIKFRLDGTCQYLKDKGIEEPFLSISNDTFLNFPLPYFNKGNGQREFDGDRYENFMKDKGFLEQYYITEEYVINHQIPYYKDKEAGKVDELKQKQFKKATRDYFVKQKENQEKLQKIKYEGEAKLISPFDKSEIGLRDNWSGVRHADIIIEDCDRKIKLLDNGWSAEDLPFINSVIKVYNSIEKDATIDKALKERYKGEFNAFLNEPIDRHIDRRRVINNLRYMYKTYEERHPDEKKAQTKILETTIRNESVEIIHLNPVENDRTFFINSLNNFYKGLEAQHRGSLIKHTDTDEMDVFKKKVLELVIQLGKKRNKSIYDDPKFEQLCKDVVRLGNAYIAAKQEEAKQKIEAKREELLAKKKAELYEKYKLDPEFDGNLPVELRRELRKYEETLKENADNALAAWKPSTKMGRTRFNSAMDIVNLAKGMEDAYTKHKNSRKELPEIADTMRKDGFTVTDMDNLELMTRRPYERGLNCIINYYGSNPMFITDHCSTDGNKKMYTKEEFKEILKPVDVKGVTNEEFAAIAYAAVLNPENIELEGIKNRWKVKSKEITKEDLLHHGRTMYTLDLGRQNGEPRANMVEHFFPWTLVPAKEKAKSAIEAYNKGDKKLLADVLAVGIKETAFECEVATYTSRNEGSNFAYSASMLEKMIKIADKDPDLKQMVDAKFTKAEKLAIQDTLRFKGFLDDCYDAEYKLQKAAYEGVSLSKKEKQDCINKIIKYEYLSTRRDQLRAQDIENNDKIKEFRNPENYNYKLMHLDELELDVDDLSTMDDVLIFKASKPIYEVGRKLRTKEGLDELNETVKKFSKGLDPDSPEQDLLRNIKKCADSIHKAPILIKQREQKRAEEFDRQRAEYERQAQQKNANNKKGNIVNNKENNPKGLG